MPSSLRRLFIANCWRVGGKYKELCWRGKM